MNYYFLLEDEKSLLKVIPHWLKFLGFQCTRVPDITRMEENNYVLQSGQGVTQLITKALFDTIDTILASSKRVDKLVVLLMLNQNLLNRGEWKWKEKSVRTIMLQSYLLILLLLYAIAASKHGFWESLVYTQKTFRKILSSIIIFGIMM